MVEPVKKRQRRSQGKDSKGSRPHEREAVDFRSQIHLAHGLYEAQFRLATCATVIRYQD